MNRRMSGVLVLITLFSLGIAIRAQVQIHKARAVVAEDLSGNLSDIPATSMVVPSPGSTADVERVQALQRQVIALQAERDKLQAALAVAQGTLAARGGSNAPAILGTVPAVEGMTTPAPAR